MATFPVSSTVNTIPPNAFLSFDPTVARLQPEFQQEIHSAAPVVPPTNSTETREQVLLAHLPLVRFVAHKIHERLPQHVELEDIVSAGIVGLIDAFNKFDPGKQVQFRSYAQFRVRGAILDSLRSLDWGSRELRRKGRSIDEAVQKLTHSLSRRPSESEIATELGMALGDYQELLGQLRSLEVGSLNELRAENSVEEEMAYLPTPPEEDPLYRCMQGEMSAQLSGAIAALPEREGRVLALYYVEEMTLREIGMVLGLVESRVSQIRASAVVNLRARLGRSRKHMETQSKPGLPGFGAKRPPQMVPAAVIQRSAASAQIARTQAAAR